VLWEKGERGKSKRERRGGRMRKKRSEESDFEFV